MSKIIIENNSSIDDIYAIDAIKAVMKLGRISNNNKQYCYYTSLDNINVASCLNKKSDRFVITDKRNE